MQIYIDNKLAALKEGTSFDYVSENRLFSGSDGYTLTITFPLKDCPQNQAIFGNINRADVSKGNVVFDCEIRDKGFHKFGCVTITEITETEVKTQFLDGRSAQNFDKSFDKLYINELTLGYPSQLTSSQVSVADAWDPGEPPVAVSLPWVNDNSGNIQNCVKYNNGTYTWEVTGLSWQPYLLELTKRICDACGYTYDFSEWEQHPQLKYILVCNALPEAWEIYDFARALPHWTIEEYFAKLELFLGCEFDIDHKAQSVAFAFSADILRSIAPIELKDVVEEYSTEVKSDDKDCKYVEARNLYYKECDSNVWKFYSCDWFVDSWRERAVVYDTLTQLLADNITLRTWLATSSGTSRPTSSGTNPNANNRDRLLYARDVDTYFVVRPVSRVQTGTSSGAGIPIYTYTCLLQPVNMFGGRIVNPSEDAEQDELEFVPVPIDYTDATYGRCMFLKSSAYDESESGSSSWEGLVEEAKKFKQTSTVRALTAGEKDKKSEYYDRIYIGWWHGVNACRPKLPIAYVENPLIYEDWEGYTTLDFSLRLNSGTDSGLAKVVYPIEPKLRYTFKFLADRVPDVRALFYIRGKRYVCEKLTATFTEHGMSRLIKGVFFEVKDD